MPPTWRLALHNLAGRKVRTGLLICAIAMATSLVVTVSGAIGSAQAGVRHRIEQAIGRADARIVHTFSGLIDNSVLETVRAWPEVALAQGKLLASITLIRADRKTDPETGELLRVSPEGLGAEFDLDDQFRTIELSDGRLPQADDEITIDPLTAEALHAEIGDWLQVQRFGPPIDLEVVGILERPILGTMQKPRVRLERATLAEAAGKSDVLSLISIITTSGTDVEAFCQRRQGPLPESLVLEPAGAVAAGLDRQILATRLAFTIATLIAFLACAFIVGTGMTTAVTEQQREIAITRCIGAGRGQIFLGQIFAGMVLSTIGAAMGIPLGLALAAGLVAVYLDFLPAGLVLEPLGIVLAVAGPLLAGVAGAAYPAWRAGRVSPMAAMRVRATVAGRKGIVLCFILGLVLIAVHVGLMVLTTDQIRFWLYVTVGFYAVHIGYFLLAVPIFVLVAAIVAKPQAALLRLPAGLLLDSARATPYRLGFTAGALMVGISVLVATWTAGTSLRDHLTERVRFADGFAFRRSGISPEAQRSIANLDFVTASCPIGYLPVQVKDTHVFGVKGLFPQNSIVVGFEPRVFFRMNRIDWKQGDPDTAIPRLRDGDAIIVAEEFLTARGLGVGDALTLGGTSEAGGSKRYEIVGVVGAAGLDLAIQFFGIRSAYLDAAVSCVFMDFSEVRQTFDSHEAHLMQLNLTEQISDEQAERRIGEAAPGVLFAGGRRIKETIESISGAMLTVTSTVAFFALVLACFGVGNVIAAGIHSRRFEFGVLLAVGATRGVLFRMILGEAILIAITGAIVGTLLGLHLAWDESIRYADLLGFDVPLAVPKWPIAIGWGVLLILTLLATTPAALSLLRRKPRELLAAGRGG